MLQCAAHYSESRCAGGEELRIDQRAAAQASMLPEGKNACISIRRPSPRFWALFSKAAGVYVCKSRAVKQWGQDKRRFEGAQHRPRGGTGAEAKGPPGSP
jgi:hypothetical protein